MRRIAAPTALMVVLTMMAGCSDGGGAEPSGGGSSSSSASGSSAAAGDPSGADSSGGAGVAPATGVRLSMPHSTVRAPDGWVKSDEIFGTETAAQDPHSISVLQLQETPAFGATSTVDQLRRQQVRDFAYPITPKSLPNAELDGVEMYHLAGPIQRHSYLEEYGALVDDRIVTLTLQLSTVLPAAERRQIIDSVIPTFRWK